MRFEGRALLGAITPARLGSGAGVRRLPIGAALAAGTGSADRCALACIGAAVDSGVRPGVASASGFGVGAAVEVVDLLGREGHAVDGLAVLLEIVVTQPADDVDVRTLAQVLGRSEEHTSELQSQS